MKLLVIAADGQETDLPAIKSFLDQIGIPYNTLIATQTTLVPGLLSDGAGHGYYQGIILTTGTLVYYDGSSWPSAFDDTEWNTLWAYEAAFGVRQMTSYNAPYGYPDYGLTLIPGQYQIDTTSAPLQATLTDAGRQAYSYLNTGSPITIRNAWVYLATPTDGTTPLLVTSEGYALASIHTYADGRQNLAVTAANNPYLIHSLLLSYGNINWVTKGLFLGERHVNFSPEIDDLLTEDDIWNTAVLTDTTGLTFRMSGADYGAAINWQNLVRANYAPLSSLTLEMAFNGEGASGIYSPDTLTPAVIANQAAFGWINHTYNHVNLDSTNYSQSLSQLTQNDTAAVNQLKLTHYFKDAFVQPDISGLANAEFQRAAWDFGTRYMIADTSRTGWNNPSPNAGFWSTYQPGILIVPRRPTNLFYNLTTPEQFVSEYNCYYGPAGTCAGGRWRYWDHNLTYSEILDKESDMMLSYLLKWDLDPLMFHQPNLGAYDGVHSLLSDLVDATVAKYNAMYNLPVRAPSLHDIGTWMANRMAYNASGVTATLRPGQGMTITATRAALIPVTGVSFGAQTETYGGQVISYISLSAGQSVTVPLPE